MTFKSLQKTNDVKGQHKQARHLSLGSGLQSQKYLQSRSQCDSASVFSSLYLSLATLPENDWLRGTMLRAAFVPCKTQFSLVISPTALTTTHGLSHVEGTLWGELDTESCFTVCQFPFLSSAWKIGDSPITKKPGLSPIYQQHSGESTILQIGSNYREDKPLPDSNEPNQQLLGLATSPNLLSNRLLSTSIMEHARKTKQDTCPCAGRYLLFINYTFL